MHLCKSFKWIQSRVQGLVKVCLSITWWGWPCPIRRRARDTQCNTGTTPGAQKYKGCYVTSFRILFPVHRNIVKHNIAQFLFRRDIIHQNSKQRFVVFVVGGGVPKSPSHLPLILPSPKVGCHQVTMTGSPGRQWRLAMLVLHVTNMPRLCPWRKC